MTETPAAAGTDPQGHRILIVARDRARAVELGEALAQPLATTVVHHAIGDALPVGSFALRLIDLTGAGRDEAERMLAGFDELRGSLVVEFGRDQIDAVAVALVATQAVLLCDPSPAERATAIAVALASPADGATARVNDRSRDGDDRLQRLNEEVARIAETLARLTGNPAGSGGQSVGDRSAAFLPQPGIGAGKAAGVRAVLRARRMRDRHFDTGLFADPAWDMLLDLYAAHLEDGQVSVSSLCIAAAVPPTTALRWIQTLHRRDLIVRRDDPFDRRRAWIALSDHGVAAMRSYWAALGEAMPRVV